MSSQMTLQGETLLDFRVNESLEIIQSAMRKSGLIPLILNFSGGKDSTVMLDLVEKITDRYICWYMVSGLEFPNAIEQVQSCCRRWNKKLYLSYPSDYVTEKYPENDFYIRLEKYGWPRPNQTWCSIYLKIRPQSKKLRKLFGKQRFYKLNGVRRKESSRRMQIYRNTHKNNYMAKDTEDRNSTIVYPILNWSNEDVKLYLEREKIKMELNPLYVKYGVSGCAWCAFYGEKIYNRVLRENPDYYSKIIKWEQNLQKPSVLGGLWMSQLRNAVLKEREQP